MKLLRFTVRRLMFAVLGLALIGGEIRRRHFEFLERVDRLESITPEYRIIAGSLLLTWTNLKGEWVDCRKIPMPSRAKDDWQHSMIEKYK